MTQTSNLKRVRKLEQQLQQHMTTFGYELIDVPLIEDAEIFLTRAGSSIIEQLFTFERLGRSLALRPEFTAVAAYRYAQNHCNDVVRWQMGGTIFVDEASNIGSQYEQHHIGAELIGQHGAMVDAEILAMAAQGMSTVAVHDWQLVIGHVGLQLHLLSQYGLDSRTYRLLLTQRERLKNEGQQAVLDYLSTILSFDGEQNTEANFNDNSQQTQQALDVLLDSTKYGTTMGGRTRHDIAGRLLKKRERGYEREAIAKALDFMTVWGQLLGNIDEVLPKVRDLIREDDVDGQILFDEWAEMLNLLRAYSIRDEQILIQPDLTRNWDYYTGIVFGIRASEQYIASGGRYDGLTQLLGGESIPAIGFAYYTEPLLDTLTNTDEEFTLYVLYGDESSETIEWATALRQAGFSVLIRDTEADILIQDSQAIYQGKLYSKTDLIQELTQ